MTTHLTVRCDRCGKEEQQHVGRPTTDVRRSWVNFIIDMDPLEKPIKIEADLCTTCRNHIITCIEVAVGPKIEEVSR